MTTAYVTYTYYHDTYLGTAIAQADFNRLALRASAVVDQLTLHRAEAIVTAAEDTGTIDDIKMATCALAEEMQTQERDGNVDGIASESVGSNSISYTETSIKQLSLDDRLSRAARLYLSDTGLMFRGFSSGEYSGSLDDED